jgi:VanZ family protein
LAEPSTDDRAAAVSGLDIPVAPATGDPAVAGTRGPIDRPAARVAFVLLVMAHLAALYWPRIEIQGPVTWTDKVAHVLLFLAPTVAGLLAGVRPAYLVAVVALHAPVSELLQHYLLPHRSGDAWDAVADLGGVVLGVTSVVVWRALRR